MRRFGLAIALIAAVVTLSAPTRAAEEVDLQLILMVDASGSVDQDEYALQRLGYAKAFRDPQVMNAVHGGFLGKIAVAYIEWTGPQLQVPIVDWIVLSDEASIDGFARQLETIPRQLYSGGTAVGNAIQFGANWTEKSGFTSTRRVIDVSGDGSATSGIPAARARDEAVAKGFAINGLPILTDEPFLDQYYANNVIGGPGSFMIPAKDFQSFAEAIFKKLILEIAERRDD